MKHIIFQFFRSNFRRNGNFMLTSSGIILGITALLLAFLLIEDEKGFDAFQKNGENIFRVNKWNNEPGGQKQKLAESPGLMAGALVKDFPEVKAATRVAPWFDDVLLTKDDLNIKIKKLIFADSNFFQFFSFHLTSGGDGASALSQPGQILLTPSLAKSIFGDENPIGKNIKAFQKLFTVSGIVADAPRQSHIQYDAIISWPSTTGGNYLDYEFMNNWLGQTVYTYVALDNPAQMGKVNGKMAAFTKQYMPNRVGMYDFYLQPLADIYLHSSDIDYLRGGKYGSATFLKTFTLISLFILLIACFNYINITTAQSLKRAKEVGVKKVLGAGRKHLISQFLTETFLTVLISSILALVLANFLLPVSNSWFEKDIPAGKLFSLTTLGFLVALIVAISFLSGLFPALLLLRFNPLSTIQNKLRISPRGEVSRKALITFQLVISIGLIGGTFILQKQFRYMLNRDLGFDKNQVLVLNTPPGINKNIDAFSNDLRALPEIKTFSICRAAMPEGTYTSTVIPDGSNGKEVPIREFGVDTNYLNTYALTLKEGRFLSRSTDTNALVVNEAMVRQMGWTEAIGKTIRFSDNVPVPVIGVVKDFNFHSLHEAVTPVVMYLTRRKNNISIRFQASSPTVLLDKLQSIWRKYESNQPFEYAFLDSYLANNYLKEKQLVNIISLFTAIAIFIACMGLYGLASFAIARRVKELGIRKVLGASVLNIMTLIIKGFMLPVVIAFLIAAPVIWYFGNEWLQNFAFHVDPNIWTLLWAGGIMVIIVLLAISFQTFAAAISNPVKNLRTE